MSITITRATLIAAYELIRTTKPFIGWKLPHADEIKFEVVRTKNFYADCDGDVIRVSAAKHGRVDTLLATIAHEAIHLHQMRHGLETANVQHNADWHKRANRVCRLHAWDRKTF